MSDHPILRDRHSQQTLAAVAVDIIEVADARGQLPCGTALCTVFTLLNHERISKNHPSVVRACVNFLMRPRTEQQQRSFAFAHTPFDNCQCDLSSRPLAQLHRPAELGVVLYAHSGPPVHRSLMAMARWIDCAFEESRSKSTTKLFKRAHQRAGRGKVAPWPYSFADIAPFGLDASVEALCAWAHSVPELVTLGIIHTFCILLDLRAHPRLMMCTVIPNTVTPLVDYVAAAWRARPSDHPTFMRCVGILSLLGQMLSIFNDLGEDHLAVLLESRERAEWMPLVTALLKAATAGKDLKKLADENAYVGDGGLGAMSLAFTAPGARLHALLRLPNDSKRYPLPTYRMLLEAYDDTGGMPQEALATWHRHLYGGHLCGAPGCNSTPVSLGHPLSVCAACAHVFYCSRSCQRHAWKHPEIAHRSICGTLKTLFERIDLWLDTIPPTEEDFETACINSLVGREAEICEIVDHLRTLYRP